jgi:3-isopropylmalate/(R)-2-methylmalate dehydratase small subunit
VRTPIRFIAGIAAPLLRDNVDTDTIISSRDISNVTKTGFGDSLFACWRYSEGVEGRTERPDFVLNRPPYRSAVMIVSGANFGCGSSREAAVWALRDFGIRCIVGVDFGTIFYQNCMVNGVLPIVLSRRRVQAIVAALERTIDAPRLVVDLVELVLTTPSGEAVGFSVPSLYRQMLLEGQDPIDATLALCDEIAAFDKAARARRPWSDLRGHRARTEQ